MTAAHYTKDAKRVRIDLGVHDHGQINEFRDSSDIIVHPDFYFPYNDLSSIKVSEPIVFSANFRPVCLPTEGFLLVTFQDKFKVTLIFLITK